MSRHREDHQPDDPEHAQSPGEGLRRDRQQGRQSHRGGQQRQVEVRCWMTNLRIQFWITTI